MKTAEKNGKTPCQISLDRVYLHCHPGLHSRYSMARGLRRLKGLAIHKARIARSVVSCQRRDAIFPHTLITGIGGTGKTALARAVGEELGYLFKEYEAAALRDRDTIIRCLQQDCKEATASGRTLLIFVDEVHRLGKLQEVFYYPLKDRYITTPNGPIHFPQFTMFAATTRKDMLDGGSFVTRFTNTWEIERYCTADIEEILCDIFTSWEMSYGPFEIASIAGRCLGIPRLAHNLAEKVRDQVYYRGGPLKITMNDVNETFQLEGLDRLGLNSIHRKYLAALLEANGKPRGLNTLAARLGQVDSVVEDTIEPILIALGFVDSTPRGRVLALRGIRHLESLKMV